MRGLISHIFNDRSPLVKGKIIGILAVLTAFNLGL